MLGFNPISSSPLSTHTPSAADAVVHRIDMPIEIIGVKTEAKSLKWVLKSRGSQWVLNKSSMKWTFNPQAMTWTIK